MERAPITAGVMAAWDVPGDTTWAYYLGILADYLIAASLISVPAALALTCRISKPSDHNQFDQKFDSF
ncbi:MAG: hypothetical protein F6J98_13610 [Moorea sp. SIO4G2]|uniref:hypothetical protein n=1 Tax=unclassified Moorena TaxID=2683338 RepID=UPI0013F7B6C8|nr:MULTISPECIES: hypothetical protein [unclassified Moorena]NEO16112.1 hypothetical protein [Moorena sp. SIO3E8]NEO61411.1 hypothetical protein [Moorena sp. SIO4G2]NEQ02617.1 hypothetical protein [Moorena sp. SIO3F7]